MYRRDKGEWFKHLDFIVLDLICIQFAYWLAYVLSGHGVHVYETIMYRNMGIFLAFADLIVIIMNGTLKNVLKKGHYQCFTRTLKHVLIVLALTTLYLFLIQQGTSFSRAALLLTFIFYLPITYIVREIWKKVLHQSMKVGGDKKLLIVASNDVIEKVVKNIKEKNYARYSIEGIAVIGKDRVGETIQDIPVVANEESVAAYAGNEWVDEVLIVISKKYPYPDKLVRQLSETGVTIHLNLAKISNVPGKKQFVEKIGPYTVLTTSINSASTTQLVIKRIVDILGGIVGCALTCIIFIFVAPCIYKESPGPIFYTQERVGKNGKIFKMYKFRSMYLDADERKAELMAQNKLQDAKMFKIDFDPRVIGNKILPDGTHKTGIGEFIRKTSLDEFPQFFNVLKGDMSIIGTRPPLTTETSLYELHHYARLAIKPGITGMWQVSGRSNITDFEEVVKLDKEYIENWNIGLDIKIFLKTILVVLKKDGSV